MTILTLFLLESFNSVLIVLEIIKEKVIYIQNRGSVAGQQNSSLTSPKIKMAFYIFFKFF